ncbi:hypothetical protein [Kocuria rhizophila]|uniref:ATP-binding protein n=1 Tax=Kocuria rhizophila (strain ATCC 9341 / DSM 348 / NBRC 103217 / DC2201) TaxID=378753 RepID=B2GJY8_KOCRD|nr:hypothetical protein [Kocuria rhizophila]ASE10951.1 hypothetical protein CEP81_04350 [Kocuria rhizophila]BAG29093.1 hypothetical protein KRH_07460 [Kocuria rhizophila DC2201]VEH75623.1 Uncharacterised protein [Kocuria rhizophila]
MSPRPGGEADKLGNRYEAAWAIQHALFCIIHEDHSLTIEDVDAEVGKASEFTYQSNRSTEVHQLKRQNGNSNSWTVKSLADLRIFEAAVGHVAAGRDFHFVSLVPCRPLQELADRARRSSDLAQFTGSWLTNELRPSFDQLTAEGVFGSAQGAWETLRGMWFSVQDEGDMIRMNAMLAECQLSGATGDLIALAIGGILLDNLGKRLTRIDLLALLALQGISPIEAAAHNTAREQAHRATKSWRDSVKRELLEPRIERVEASQLLEALHVHRTSFVSGSAGGGKSSVLEQSVELLEAAGAEVLAIRLDRLDTFASTADLGRQLGLDTSPAASLALAAEGRDAYLVIDQLDAVSLASGRMPESFDVVVDLIGEALSVSGTKVILACRAFDIENDHRIRSLADQRDTTTISVGPLSDAAINASVVEMGLDPSRLTSSQRVILQTPMHLVLLKTTAAQEGALAFQSKGSLFEGYWERKRQASRMRRERVRFNDVIARVANEASNRQTLSIPIELLDEDDLIDDANVLISEHVLARDDERVAFFHETFFDYAFARQWVSRSESLVDFLLQDEQELFRRAQVRQILQHLSERDPDRFRSEVTAVLASSRARFHIKQTVIAVLSSLSAPTSADTEAILQLVKIAPNLAEQLWLNTRRVAWFRQFHEDGHIDAWLDSGDSALQARALNLMLSGTKDEPARVAGLLHTRRSAPQHLDWVRWTVGRADAHRSRELFDELLAAVRAGGFDEAGRELWLTVHDLAEHEPLWAIELIQARIIDHPEGLQLNDDGSVALLKIHDYSAAELVREAATAEPLAFAQTVVPYLLRVMAASAYEPRPNGPIPDRHFCPRLEPDNTHDRDLDDALFTGALGALEAVAVTRPIDIRPLLDELASDLHDAAQFLLYRALTAGSANFADWAANLLLTGGARLDCGYIANPRWVARELLRAVAPFVDDEVHQKLELLVRDLRNPYETRHNLGRSAFTFLSAMEEARLSPAGIRRLAEYRRKFKETAPSKPVGMTGGFIGSPIHSDAAEIMSDDQWLRAMIRYDSNETNWDTFTGGARELSRVLSTQAATDPVRFARFALRLTSDLNTAYADAVLMGLANADYSVEAAAHVYGAVRHIAALGHPDVDRWLGGALRRYYREVPLDLVELILDRTLHASDPQDDTPIFTRDGDDGRGAADMRQNSINTARGSLAEALGDLLVYDADGERTALVRPHLEALASDPVIFVRSSVAHTVAASLRHARPDAVAAFHRLIDTDDRLLATDLVQQLMIHIGNVDSAVIEPVIERMLSSSDSEAREAGGALAAFAALEWGRPRLMARALAGDAGVRKATAEVCANRIDRTSNVELASSTLMSLMHDDEVEVREAAAKLASHLRDQPLRPFSDLLEALTDSPTYENATPQLLITLQHAPDKVDELVLQVARRFISVFGSEASDLRTGAAGDARYISQLVVRGLAQSRDKEHRGALLDILDGMLELGVYGVDDAVSAAERQ